MGYRTVLTTNARGYHRDRGATKASGANLREDVGPLKFQFANVTNPPAEPGI